MIYTCYFLQRTLSRPNIFSPLTFFLLQTFEVSDLLQGLNFSKVLNALVALNKATEGMISLPVWFSPAYCLFIPVFICVVVLCRFCFIIGLVII